jgi:hypothetical protein
MMDGATKTDRIWLAVVTYCDEKNQFADIIQVSGQTAGARFDALSVGVRRLAGKNLIAPVNSSDQS